MISKIEIIRIIKYIIIGTVLFAPISVELFAITKLENTNNDIFQIKLGTELFSFAQLVLLFAVIRFSFNDVSKIFWNKATNIFFWSLAIITLLLLISLRVHNLDNLFPQDFYRQSLMVLFASSAVFFLSFILTYQDKRIKSEESKSTSSVKPTETNADKSIDHKNWNPLVIDILKILLIALGLSILTYYLFPYEVNTPNFATIYIGWFTLTTFIIGSINNYKANSNNKSGTNKES